MILFLDLQDTFEYNGKVDTVFFMPLSNYDNSYHATAQLAHKDATRTIDWIRLVPDCLGRD